MAAAAVGGTAAPAADSAPAHPRIIGGQIAEPGTFPWLAHVQSHVGSISYNCTGTVVSSNVILTAAHCVVDEETLEPRSPETFNVVTGSVDWTSAERVVSSVRGVLVYPGYEPEGPLDGWGDAALLQLATPVAAPGLKLAASKFWGPGTAAAIVGWGRTSPSQETPTVLLRWAEVAVQSQAYCEEHAPVFHPLGEICTIDAPDYTSGTCHGDSGGPLIGLLPGTEEPVVIGVSVFGFDECSTSEPSVATRADLIDTWVNNRIAELAPPQPTRPKPVPQKPAPVTAPALPTMTKRTAIAYTRTALGEALGGRFADKRQFRVTCLSLEAPKQKCGVNWTRGGDDYYGHVTVFFSFQGGALVWDHRMTVHWVNDWCYFHSGLPGTCTVHTVRR